MGLLLMSVVIVGMGVPESMAGEDQVRAKSDACAYDPEALRKDGSCSILCSS